MRGPPPYGGYHAPPPLPYRGPPPGAFGPPPPHMGHYGMPPPHYHHPPPHGGPPPHYGGPPPHGPPPPHYGGPPPHGEMAYHYAAPPSGPPHPGQMPPPRARPELGPAPHRPILQPAPGPQGEPPGAAAAPPGVDFAVEKPAAYRAFEQMAIRPEQGGTSIALPNSMCLDRHVPDFLSCLRCWFPRTFGDPKLTKRPFRLRCLDLSANALSDDSVCSIMETMRTLDVRVERLLFARNGTRQRGLNVITQYLWSCPDALWELDLTDNEVFADPKAGPTPGSDIVSALLRCIYNHSAYPMTVDYGREGMKVVPFLLRLGGNGIRYPEKLLRQIRSKGGKERVHVCASADPYPHTGQEYLAVCLPDFLSQRALEASSRQLSAAAAAPALPAPATVATPPRAPHRPPSVVMRPAVVLSEAPQVPPAEPEAKKRTRRRSRSGEAPKAKKRKKAKGEGGRRGKAPREDAGAAPEAAAPAAPEAAPAAPEAAAESAPAAEELAEGAAWRPSRSRSASSDGSSARRRRRSGGRSGGESPVGVVEGQVLAQRAGGDGANAAQPAAQGPYRAPNDEEQKQLQRDVDQKLQSIGGLPSDQSTRDMLAEFVVCMLVARKGMPEIAAELETFLGEHTGKFTDWFQQHLQEHFS